MGWTRIQDWKFAVFDAVDLFQEGPQSSIDAASYDGVIGSKVATTIDCLSGWSLADYLCYWHHRQDMPVSIVAPCTHVVTGRYQSVVSSSKISDHPDDDVKCGSLLLFHLDCIVMAEGLQ